MGRTYWDEGSHALTRGWLQKGSLWISRPSREMRTGTWLPHWQPQDATRYGFPQWSIQDLTVIIHRLLIYKSSYIVDNGYYFFYNGTRF